MEPKQESGVEMIHWACWVTPAGRKRLQASPGKPPLRHSAVNFEQTPADPSAYLLWRRQDAKDMWDRRRGLEAVSCRPVRMLGSFAVVGTMLAVFALLTISVAQACSDTVGPIPTPATQRAPPLAAVPASLDPAFVKSVVSAAFSVCRSGTSERGCGVGSCCTACSSGVTVECWSAAKNDVLQTYISPTQTWLPSTGASTPFRPPLPLIKS